MTWGAGNQTRYKQAAHLTTEPSLHFLLEHKSFTNNNVFLFPEVKKRGCMQKLEQIWNISTVRSHNLIRKKKLDKENDTLVFQLKRMSLWPFLGSSKKISNTRIQ